MLIIFFLFFSLHTFASSNTIGFIIPTKATLYNDYKHTNSIGHAYKNQNVIIVKSIYNNNQSQKINLNGFNYWIHLKDIMVVNYPEFYEDGNIDHDRKRIINEYLKRIDNTNH